MKFFNRITAYFVLFTGVIFSLKSQNLDNKAGNPQAVKINQSAIIRTSDTDTTFLRIELKNAFYDI